jgi:sugar phosphate isomerase/epimerase
VGELTGELSEIVRAGYAGIETTNLFRHHPNEVYVRRLFGESGLALCGCRCPFPVAAEPDGMAEELRYIRSLGSRYLIVGGVGERDPGADAYRNAARLLNEAGKRCEEAGVFLCYEPTEWELTRPAGRPSGIDVLDQETDARWVKYCLNLDLLAASGLEPAQFIDAHRERAVYFHLQSSLSGERKPGGPPVSEPLENAPHNAHLAAVALNPEWLVYEHPRFGGPPAKHSK